MKTLNRSVVTSAVFLGFIGLAVAEDPPMGGQDMAAMKLPAACQIGEAPAMAGMEAMQSGMPEMTEAQSAAMQGMMATHQPMMQGMMAADPDVAFACGMIPHHMAAISMAEVELQYGDSDEMKAMAQKIIDAQKREIDELTTFVEAQ